MTETPSHESTIVRIFKFFFPAGIVSKGKEVKLKEGNNKKNKEG